MGCLVWFCPTSADGVHLEALRWWRKAAEQGEALAQNNLGWMYYKGHMYANGYIPSL